MATLPTVCAEQNKPNLRGGKHNFENCESVETFLEGVSEGGKVFSLSARRKDSSPTKACEPPRSALDSPKTPFVCISRKKLALSTRELTLCRFHSFPSQTQEKARLLERSLKIVNKLSRYATV